jgi:hypothetical protein
VIGVSSDSVESVCALGTVPVAVLTLPTAHHSTPRLRRATGFHFRCLQTRTASSAEDSAFRVTCLEVSDGAAIGRATLLTPSPFSAPRSPDFRDQQERNVHSLVQLSAERCRAQ